MAFGEGRAAAAARVQVQCTSASLTNDVINAELVERRSPLARRGIPLAFAWRPSTKARKLLAWKFPPEVFSPILGRPTPPRPPVGPAHHRTYGAVILRLTRSDGKADAG